MPPSLDHVSTRRYYTFHDRDVAPEGETLEETNKNLDQVGCIVHLASCILHLRNLYGALFKLPVARSMLPVARCNIGAGCILHAPHRLLSDAYCRFHFRRCMLHAACLTVDTLRCAVHVVAADIGLCGPSAAHLVPHFRAFHSISGGRPPRADAEGDRRQAPVG